MQSLYQHLCSDLLPLSPPPCLCLLPSGNRHSIRRSSETVCINSSSSKSIASATGNQVGFLHTSIEVMTIQSTDTWPGSAPARGVAELITRFWQVFNSESISIGLLKRAGWKVSLISLQSYYENDFISTTQSKWIGCWYIIDIHKIPLTTK